MIEVAASLLDVEEEKVIQTIYDLEVAGVDYFQMDVMDGKFVEKDTTQKMRQYAEYVKNITTIPMEIHLMVKEVENYIKSYLALEPYMILFHLEACHSQKEIIKMIQLIKENHVKVGICINPSTSIAEVYDYLPYIHRVLIMTVEPGKGGQVILPETIKKINELNIFAYENGIELDIEVDGGINEATAPLVIDAGANILTSGNYLVTAKEKKQAIKTLKNS